jgi:O-antigen/teichoic acid export membrane protein
LLAISQYILIVFGPSGCALSMTGRHVLELKILLVGLVVAVLVCWIAIPIYGQLGAAVATCASVVVANLTRVLFIRHSIGAFPFGIDILAITATGIGLAWVVSAAIAQFSLPSVWNTICGIGCFIVVYAVVGWTHLLSESEKTGIRAAVKSTTHGLFASGL